MNLSDAVNCPAGASGEHALARADISLERAQSLTDEFEINV